MCACLSAIVSVDRTNFPFPSSWISWRNVVWDSHLARVRSHAAPLQVALCCIISTLSIFVQHMHQNKRTPCRCPDETHVKVYLVESLKNIPLLREKRGFKKSQQFQSAELVRTLENCRFFFFFFLNKMAPFSDSALRRLTDVNRRLSQTCNADTHWSGTLKGK